MKFLFEDGSVIERPLFTTALGLKRDGKRPVSFRLLDDEIEKLLDADEGKADQWLAHIRSVLK